MYCQIFGILGEGYVTVGFINNIFDIQNSKNISM